MYVYGSGQPYLYLIAWCCVCTHASERFLVAWCCVCIHASERFLVAWCCVCIHASDLFLGLARTIYIYTVYIRYLWQETHQINSHLRCIYTVLANPRHIAELPPWQQQCDVCVRDQECCCTTLLWAARRGCLLKQQTGAWAIRAAATPPCWGQHVMIAS